MGLANLNRPDFNQPGLRLSERMERLTGYLTTMEEEVRFALCHIEAEDLGQELRGKVESGHIAGESIQKSFRDGDMQGYVKQLSASLKDIAAMKALLAGAEWQTVEIDGVSVQVLGRGT